MHSTAKLLEAAVPRLTLEGRAVVTTLAMLQGRPGSAQQFARNVGLRESLPTQPPAPPRRSAMPRRAQRLDQDADSCHRVGGVQQQRSSSAALRSARDPSTDYKMVDAHGWAVVGRRSGSEDPTGSCSELVDRCKVLQSAFAAGDLARRIEMRLSSAERWPRQRWRGVMTILGAKMTYRQSTEWQSVRSQMPLDSRPLAPISEHGSWCTQHQGRRRAAPALPLAVPEQKACFPVHEPTWQSCLRDSTVLSDKCYRDWSGPAPQPAAVPLLLTV